MVALVCNVNCDNCISWHCSDLLLHLRGQREYLEAVIARKINLLKLYDVEIKGKMQ